jgi:hypothetical protein
VFIMLTTHSIDSDQGPFGGPAALSSSTPHEEEKIMSPYLIQLYVIGPVFVGLLFAMTLMVVSISDARR